MDKLKIALCQMKVTIEKKENINHGLNLIDIAAKNGAKIIALPEMFNCPYNNSYFREYSESYPLGETLQMLSMAAKKNNVYIVGGSIPEIDNEKIYNTSFVFDSNGELIAKHRKVHLFDIDIKDRITFKESDVLTPGNEVTIFNTPYGKFGVMICYDIRFPEFARIMALKGVKGIFVPAAFNMTTGPAHWELSFRARALDNQLYTFGISPARDENSCYTAYGNTLAVNSWGEVIGRLKEKEDILYLELDMDDIYSVRESLPLLKHRRPEIYNQI